MVSGRSKPRVVKYVFSGACTILSVRNSGASQQKRTLKIAMGEKPCAIFALEVCLADHRSPKYHDYRRAYKLQVPIILL